VLNFIEACTDTPPEYTGGEKPPWRSRKQRLLDHIREAVPSVQRIALADKVHNARTILADYRKDGDAIWERFNAGKSEQLWFYQSLVSAFREAGAAGYLMEELERIVAELQTLCEAV
jgi:(p)ppGpp synthase/HD superfamily hydrolase